MKEISIDGRQYIWMCDAIDPFQHTNYYDKTKITALVIFVRDKYIGPPSKLGAWDRFGIYSLGKYSGEADGPTAAEEIRARTNDESTLQHWNPLGIISDEKGGSVKPWISEATSFEQQMKQKQNDLFRNIFC